jgi:hypothetical protein
VPIAVGEPVILYLHGGHDILGLSLQRQEAAFPEGIEPMIAPNEPHQVVASGLRFPEREGRGASWVGKLGISTLARSLERLRH